MKSYEFTIVEYAQSDVQPNGIPFAVVFSVRDARSKSVRGLTLVGWKRFIRQSDYDDLEQLEGFVADLHYYSRQAGPTVGDFFKCVEGLSIGPIRLLSSGVIALDHPLSTFVPTVESPLAELDANTFGALVQDLLQVAAFSCRKPMHRSVVPSLLTKQRL